MKKQAKSRENRAKRRNNQPNPGKTALIPAVVKAEGTRGKGASTGKAEIPVAVKTSPAAAKPVAVATAEIPVEFSVSRKPARSKSKQGRSKRTRNVTVMPMAVARTAAPKEQHTTRRRSLRRPRRVVARRPRTPVRNKASVGAPSFLGLVVNAAAVVQETVVNAAAKFGLVVIDGLESIVRAVFRFEKRATEKVTEVVESVPREAADAASRVASMVDRLAAA